MTTGDPTLRWQLHRAGIMNVYQYGDEVLHFAGGRLLLRGVNGSGKSTAMNMLLPFLLEADTRRIDAAGEQSRVLHAWMLTGRDEPQPVGYLWIEFRRGDEYLACGCGIRANRSTDRVTTWWFVTDRRPGVDFSLVESRVPLSIDALRALLGPSAVFNESQRPMYRAEVRSRLFGGADLDQHLRLLHIVRSPRVGDRIAEDLPRYLSDALPQLSDAAIDDAAQPLEDLEEHRRNIEDLARTQGALHALNLLYASYAAHDLRTRARGASEVAAAAVAARADERGIGRQLDQAHDRRRELGTRTDRLTADEQRLRAEIEALTSQQAYQAGAELTDLRERVAAAVRTLRRATNELEQRESRSRQRADAANTAHAQHRADAEQVERELVALAQRCQLAGVGTQLPLVPEISATAPRPGDPLAPVDGVGFDLPLGPLLAAAHDRRSQIAEVASALEVRERADNELRRSEQHAQIAAEECTLASEAYAAAVTRREQIAQRWTGAVNEWVGALAMAETADDRDEVPRPLASVTALDTGGSRHDVVAALIGRGQLLVDERRRRAAAAHARRDAALVVAADAERVVQELEARSLPPAPSMAWQRVDRSATLAEWIDFAPGLSQSEQAGLEAALEASGLLAAEVGPDGLTLVDGQVIIVAREPVAHPLSNLVTVTVPDDADPELARLVERFVQSIATEPTGAVTYATVDGYFGTASTTGRHHKDVAEHIGVSARRSTLERARAQARTALAAALDQAHICTADLEAAELAVAEGATLLDAFPPVADLDDASRHVSLRREDFERAAQRLDELERHRRAAEEAFAEAASAARRIAVERALPDNRAALDEVDRALRDVTGHCQVVTAAATTAARSLVGWAARIHDWRQSVADVEQARAEHGEVSVEHDTAAARLATLEDSVGAEYATIVAALETSRGDLSSVAKSLAATRQAQLDTEGDVARLEAQLAAAAETSTRAEGATLACLSVLRVALAVAGYREGAFGRDDRPDEADVTLPVVADSPEGLSALARFLFDRVRALGAEVSADGVRQSLRQRRDALGAGWDAEDRQADPSLPLLVEVTGPLGRMPLPAATREVAHQVRSLEGLLSAKQTQALRNLLQGLIAKEVATKLHDARELIGLMNRRLASIRTSHGIGVSLRWTRSDELDDAIRTMIELLAKPPDLRDGDEDARLVEALSARIAQARREQPDVPYRSLIADVLDYRTWFRTTVMLHRPGAADERLGRRTALSEGEKKVVSYLALFAAVAASCDAIAQDHLGSPRFVLIDDAFAKVSEDNHPKLFGLLVELDLDFIATSERLWGTHDTVPELSITEVVRDADLGVIVLEHFTWNGTARAARP